MKKIETVEIYSQGEDFFARVNYPLSAELVKLGPQEGVDKTTRRMGIKGYLIFSGIIPATLPAIGGITRTAFDVMQLLEYGPSADKLLFLAEHIGETLAGAAMVKLCTYYGIGLMVKAMAIQNKWRELRESPSLTTNPQ